MRELTAKELAQVSGGFNLLLLLGLPGAVFIFGYNAGKEMAERDNRTMVPSSVAPATL